MSHTLTFRNDFLREHSPVLAVSVLLHLTLLVLLALNLNLLPRRPAQPVRLAIQATVVNAQALRQRAAEQERIQRQTEDLVRQREAERKQRLEEQNQEAQRREDEQHRLADQKREAQLKQKQEADKIRIAKLEQQKKAADDQAKVAAEAKRKADAARKEAQTQADAARKQAQTKADLARQMAEEEGLAAAADAGELDQYREVIRQKVQRNWSQPATARPGDNCDVKVQQIPGGEIVSAVAVNCTGDAAFARSVETAVLRSSPLPLPSNPALFERNLLFNFKPEK